MITVDSQGQSGGIAFLWQNKDEVSLNTLSRNHIDLVITHYSPRMESISTYWGIWGAR